MLPNPIDTIWRYYLDFDGDGDVDPVDLNFVNSHFPDNCSSPNNP